MKRIVSVILSAALILGVLYVPAYGIDKDSGITEYPVIIVAGYSSTNLIKIMTTVRRNRYGDCPGTA